MEIFTIDGTKAMLARKNKALLTYLGPGETAVSLERIGYYSAFRFRRKTMTNVLYLNMMRRKRMLELISGVGGVFLLN